MDYNFLNTSRPGKQPASSNLQVGVAPKRKGSSSTQSIYSLKSVQTRISAQTVRENLISKKIKDHYQNTNAQKADKITQTIFDDIKVYNRFRRNFDHRFQENSMDRLKIMRRKKATSEKHKLLLQNTIEKLYLISKCVAKAYKYYEKRYIENDSQRLHKLYEAMYAVKEKEEKKEPALTSKKSRIIDKDSRAHDILKEKAVSMLIGVIGGLSGNTAKKDSDEEDDSESSFIHESPLAKRQRLHRKRSFNFDDQRSMASQSSRVSTFSRGGPRFSKSTSIARVRLHKMRSIAKLMNDPKQEGSLKNFFLQLQKFMESPFKEDQKFAIMKLVQVSRDELEECEEHIVSIFYDKVFKTFQDTSDQEYALLVLDIIISLMDSAHHRKLIVEKKVLRFIFKKLSSILEDTQASASTLHIVDKRQRKNAGKAKVIDKSIRWYESRSVAYKGEVLEKLAQIICLMCYYDGDFEQEILDLELVPFLVKVTDQKFEKFIRQKAILSMSLLVSNKVTFAQLMKNNVISLMLKVCMDPNEDMWLKELSTQAIVHFAFLKESVQELIRQGVMNMFETFEQKSLESPQLHAFVLKQNEEELRQKEILQTNVSWIFLALSNNGIPALEMLKKGITRDMFLVACNPEFHKIRYIVITSFAVLGRSSEIEEEVRSDEKMRIKYLATSSQHLVFQNEPERVIQILLKFCVAEKLKVQQTAYQSLQEFLMTNSTQLPDNLPDIIQAFLVGSIHPDSKIQRVSASALSFLVTHRIVYQNSDLEDQKQPSEADLKAVCQEYSASEPVLVLDAIMNLSGSDDPRIRAIAFSTLSSLAQLSSKYKTVKTQLQRDIQIEEESHSLSSISKSSTSLSLADESPKAAPKNSASKYYGFINTRLKAQKDAFFQKFRTKSAEDKHAGFYSLLRMAQDPVDTEILATVNRSIIFIQFVHSIQTKIKNFIDNDDSCSLSNSSSPSDSDYLKKRQEKIELSQKESEMLETIQENEKYFIEVIAALRHCESTDLICHLMKIIYHYSLQNDYFKFLSSKWQFIMSNYENFHGLETPCCCLRCVCKLSKLQGTNEIINSNTVLWILETLEAQSKSQKNNFYSCICSITLLSIVDRNDIAIGHQEQAIIKRFNKVLNNIDVFTQDLPSNQPNSPQCRDPDRPNSALMQSSGPHEEKQSSQKIKRKTTDPWQVTGQESDHFSSNHEASSSSSYVDSFTSSSSSEPRIDSGLQLMIDSDEEDKKTTSLAEQLKLKGVQTPLVPQSRNMVQVTDESSSTRVHINFHDELTSIQQSESRQDSRAATTRNEFESHQQDYLQGPINASMTSRTQKRSRNSKNEVNSRSTGHLKKGLDQAALQNFTLSSKILEQIDEAEYEQISNRVSDDSNSDDELSEIEHKRSSQGTSSPLQIEEQLAAVKATPLSRFLLNSSQEQMDSSSLERSLVKNDQSKDKDFEDKIDLTKIKIQPVPKAIEVPPTGRKRISGGIAKNPILGARRHTMALKKTQSSIIEQRFKKEKFQVVSHDLRSSESKSKDGANQQESSKASAEQVVIPEGQPLTLVQKSPKKKPPLKKMKEDKQVSPIRKDKSSRRLSLNFLVGGVPFQNDFKHVPQTQSLDDDFRSITEVMEAAFKLRDLRSVSISRSERALAATKNIELYLRDSLIKAFMIIFTNEQSQHLLLNYDLIDIAFNCLSSSSEITLETQRNVARLTSMILKFPKVQQKLMKAVNTDVLGGMASLLDSFTVYEYLFKSFIDNFVCAPESYDFQSSRVVQLRMRIHTIKYMLEACHLVSYNRSFIMNETQSLKILKPVLQLLKCPNILACLSKQDFVHLTSITNNILKLSEKNTLYFHQQDRFLPIVNLTIDGLEKFKYSPLRNQDTFNSSKASVYKKQLTELFQSNTHMDNLPDMEGLGLQSEHSRSKTKSYCHLSKEDFVLLQCLQILNTYSHCLINWNPPPVCTDLIVKQLLIIIEIYLGKSMNWCNLMSDCKTREDLLNIVNTQYQIEIGSKRKELQKKLGHIKTGNPHFKTSVSQISDGSSHSSIISEKDEEEESANTPPLEEESESAVASSSPSKLPSRRVNQRFQLMRLSQQLPISKQGSFLFGRPAAPSQEPEEDPSDVIKVENKHEQEVKRLEQEFLFYSHLNQLRSNTYRIAADLLRAQHISHVLDANCLITRELLTKIGMMELIVEELSLLALKMNQVAEERKQRQESNWQHLYDRCFELISKANRGSSMSISRGQRGSGIISLSKKSSSISQFSEVKESLIQHLTKSDENDRVQLSEDHLDTLDQEYNEMFLSLVSCLRAMKLMRPQIKSILLKEDRRRGLIAFFEDVVELEKKQTIFFVISDLLIELVNEPSIQQDLLRLRHGRVEIWELDNQEYFQTFGLVSSTVERLFGVAQAADLQEGGDNLMANVAWLVDVLKLSEFLDLKKKYGKLFQRLKT